MSEIKVDYNNSILSISNSLLRHFSVPSGYATMPEVDKVLAKGYTNVVLMIVDCLGSAILHKNLPQNSFLNQHVLKNISSVFPPTTAAATTTFHSGLPPIHSGWLGWMIYFPQYDKIIELFRNTEFYSGREISEPAPAETFLKYKTIYEQITEKNPEVEYHKVFPPFDPNGVSSFAEMCEKVVQISGENSHKKIISAYWTEPDHSIHIYGTQAPEIKEILKDIEAQIKKMSEQLKDTVVIISADHGAVDVEEVYLNTYADICETFLRPPALEARFLTFFIKPDKKDVFERLFKEYFGDDFRLFSKQEFLSSGICGPAEIHPLAPDFFGDFVAIGVKNKNLRYSTGEREFSNLKADHAGFSSDEMTVPLIILEPEE